MASGLWALLVTGLLSGFLIGRISATVQLNIVFASSALS